MDFQNNLIKFIFDTMCAPEYISYDNFQKDEMVKLPLSLLKMEFCQPILNSVISHYLNECHKAIILKDNVESGKPYLGCSAGSNIGGINMKTTNDMPIVYPPSFDCMGLVPFNINPHYLDPNPEIKHNGETRETRIKEFLTQNDINVVGLREGSWIRRINNRITVEGSELTRIFEKGKEPYEIKPGTEL
jgi:dipeptidase E